MHKRLQSYFLPDLCNTRAILILLVVSEALVLAVTLIENSLTQFSWQRFSIVSFFVLWVCLLSIAVICPLRKCFMQLSVWLASLLAVLLVAGVVFFVSVAGELLWPFYSNGIDWLWVLRNCLISCIFAAMAMRYFYVQSQWRLKTQAELSARLAVLQANIRPHFFFNTLNTVASLIMLDAEKAERMLLDLAHLFRAVLKNEDKLVGINQEIELAQRYLAIEQVRLGERMQVTWELPTNLPELQVPPLLLQPLLENAVYHGIQPNIESGFIRVQLTPEKEGWLLVITNSKTKMGSVAGNQMAQDNVRARLAALSHSAKLLTDNQETTYQVKILLGAGVTTEQTIGTNA